MTLGEMRSEVYRRLRENASSPVHFTEAEIDSALNEGLEELADATEWCERTVNVQLAKLRTYYDLRSVVAPEQFLGMRRAHSPSTNRWIEPTALRVLDLEGYTRWETVIGTPYRMFQRGLWWLGLYPHPSADGDLVRITCVVTPEALEEDDEPDFPEEFHRGVVEYAVYDLLAQDGETDKALRKGGPWEAFLVKSGELEEYVDERASIDRAGIIGSADGAN